MKQGYHIKILLVVLLVLLLDNSPLAQQHHSQQFTIRDGLPSNRVREFFKDSRDILWIGTDAGLATFDGAKIRRVSLPSDLESQRVWAITEDQHGNLWLGTYGGGILKFDGRNFTSITTPQLPSNQIRVLKYSERFNGLLVGTQYGFSFIGEEKTFSFVPDTITNERFLVMGFIETDSGAIFHTFSHGAFHVNIATGEVKPLPPDSPLQVLSSSASFVTSVNDTIIGLNKTGLRIIGREGVRDFHDLGQVFHVEEDANGHLWISVWSYTDMDEPGGLFLFDGKNMKRIGTCWGVNSPMVWKTFIDPASCAILVATDGEGFYKLIDKGISQYPAQFFGTEKLNIYDIEVFNGELWATAYDRVIAGTEENGFRVLDEEFFYRQDFYPGHHTDSAIINPPARFLDVHIDLEQNLWVGSVNGLFKLRDHPFGFWRFNLGKRFGENIIVLPDGRAYSGSWGFFRIVYNIIASDRYSYINYNVHYPTDISRIVQRGDEFWFSSFSHGLYRYSDGHFKWFGNEQPHLPKNLSSLTIDRQNNIVAGTHDGRVLVIEGSDSLAIRHELNNTNGIIGNEILWLLNDSRNRLWIGTNMGLNIIDLDELYSEGHTPVHHIDESEGYLDYLVRSAVEDENGIVWLGGTDNLVRIDPRRLLPESTKARRVELTGFSVNFKEVRWDSITKANPWRNIPINKVILPYHKNNITLAFGTDNLLNPDKVLYSYYLKGFSEEPSPFGSHIEVTFTNLSPGSYKLRVEAVNTQSQSFFIPLTVEFRIRHPWWQTWYFYSLVIIAALVIIALVMRLRILRVKKLEQVKRDHEKRLNSIRIQAVQAQMNPHFVFNVLSSIQSFMLDNNMDATMEYLSDFSVLIRKTMENMSEETILLAEEIEYLKRYIKLEDLRMGNSIQSRMIVGKGVDIHTLRIPPMIVQPFVENAIKHGLALKEGDRRLTVSFRQNDSTLSIQVCDNGLGMKTHQGIQTRQFSQPSRGIKNTTERIQYFTQNYNKPGQEKYGVSISNRQRNGCVLGVRVEIKLPIFAESYSG